MNTIKDGPMDPTGRAADIYEHIEDCHLQLCMCSDVNKCIVVYRRCVIHERIFHSLLYSKCKQSISYFVEYFINDPVERRFGVIQLFLTCNQEPFSLVQRHPIKQKYSDYFVTSKYYNLLKAPLDLFFVVLDKKPCQIDLIPVENVLKHCIVFDSENHLVVTTVSSYSEHD